MTTAVDETIYTTEDLARKLRCSKRKVRTEAAALGLGINLQGKAGFRYTEADYTALCQAMRPVQPEPTRRRRRASG